MVPAALFLPLLSGAPSAAAASAAPPRPHLVYVLSDNLGWANVGYHHKSPEVITPNINSLVQTGVELDRLYTYKFCSPSRSSLMTGRLPIVYYQQFLATAVVLLPADLAV